MKLETLYDKHNGQCYWCGHFCYLAQPRRPRRSESPCGATRDHIITQASGGKNGANLVLACARCNSLRGRMPAELFAEYAKTLPPPTKFLSPPEEFRRYHGNLSHADSAAEPPAD